VIAGLYGAYTLIGGEHGVIRLIAMDRRQAELKDEIAAVDAEAATLRHKSGNLDRTIEEEARIEHGYAAPHEEIYEIVRVDSLGGIEEPESGSPPAARGGAAGNR
jgi:cell division protein FtsB